MARPIFADHTYPLGARWYRVLPERMGPQIFVGFLLDPEDDELEFTDLHRGIDLALFIECKPSVRPKGPAWKDRVRILRDHFSGTISPTIKVQYHEEMRQSRYRKFTVQECLADAIRHSHDDESQSLAIYDRLQSWATVLFEDGALEQAMHETWKDTPANGAVSA